MGMLAADRSAGGARGEGEEAGPEAPPLSSSPFPSVPCCGPRQRPSPIMSMTAVVSRPLPHLRAGSLTSLRLSAAQDSDGSSAPAAIASRPTYGSPAPSRQRRPVAAAYYPSDDKVYPAQRVRALPSLSKTVDFGRRRKKGFARRRVLAIGMDFAAQKAGYRGTEGWTRRGEAPHRLREGEHLLPSTRAITPPPYRNQTVTSRNPTVIIKGLHWATLASALHVVPAFTNTSEGMEAAAIMQASTSHEEATEAVKPVALQRDVPHILWSRDCAETRTKTLILGLGNPILSAGRHRLRQQRGVATNPHPASSPRLPGGSFSA